MEDTEGGGLAKSETGSDAEVEQLDGVWRRHDDFAVNSSLLLQQRLVIFDHGANCKTTAIKINGLFRGFH